MRVLMRYEGLDPTFEPGDNGILEPVDPAPSTESFDRIHVLIGFRGSWYPPWNEQQKHLKIDVVGRRSFPFLGQKAFFSGRTGC